MRGASRARARIADPVGRLPWIAGEVALRGDANVPPDQRLSLRARDDGDESKSAAYVTFD